MENKPTSTLVLVRGLPGSGKTSLVESIFAGRAKLFAADDYFIRDGVYKFDGSLLGRAHNQCLELTEDALKSGGSERIRPIVAVHNTFVKYWEMRPYLELGRRVGARVIVLSLFDGGLTDAQLAERNTHGVPVEKISQMRENFQHDWRKRDSFEQLEALTEKHGEDATAGDILFV